MAYIPNSGSVVAFEGGAWTSSVVGSVSAYLQSSGGSVITVNQSSSIIGINAGSVVAISQGSVINVQQGSIAAVIIGGSVASAGVANQSVSGTIGASIIGQVTVVSSIAGGIFPVSGSVAAVITNTNVNVSGSVVAFLGNSTNASVITVGTAVANQSVSGNVGATQIGAWTASVVGSVSAYLQSSGASVITVSQNSSIIAINAGSVIAVSQGSVTVLQGTNPWVETFSNSSILAVPVGSVITVLQSSSIFAVQAGTHIASAINLITRNDTLASIVGADLTTRPQMGDSQGRTITKPFAPEDATIISYTGSVVSGSVTLIQASAVGKKSYITDYWITNTGSTLGVVTFKDGSTSVIGYGTGPATSGSNSPGINIPLKTANAQDLTFSVSPSQSILYLTVKGYQAQ